MLKEQLEQLVERLATKLSRQYRGDAEVLVAGVIVRIRNLDGPESTHYLFDPASRPEVIELLDGVRRTLIEEEY